MMPAYQPRHIKTVKDLERLPVTTKDELVKLQAKDPPFGGYLAVPVNSLNRVYVSPGRSTMPGVRSASWPTWSKAWSGPGMPKPGDVVMVSNAYHMVPAGLCLTDALDVMGCTVVPAGVGQTDLQVRVMHDLKVSAIFSFPSFTMSLLKRAEEMGYNFKKDFNLKYCSGGGERHIQVLRKVFENEYGLTVGDGYGTADLGGVAYDCGLGEGYHYDDDSLHYRDRGPEDREAGQAPGGGRGGGDAAEQGVSAGEVRHRRPGFLYGRRSAPAAGVSPDHPHPGDGGRPREGQRACSCT